MADKPPRIWASTGLYYNYVTDWSEGEWSDSKEDWMDEKGGVYVEYVRADLLEAAERDAKEAETYAQELENDVFALRSGNMDTLVRLGQAAETQAALQDQLEIMRIALADAIRRPMGVVPASAEGLISILDLDAAETRRVKGKA